MTRLCTRLPLLVAFALGGLAGPSPGSALELEVGQPFPDLALRTLDGGVRRVSDFRGSKVVLHVFASW